MALHAQVLVMNYVLDAQVHVIQAAIRHVLVVLMNVEVNVGRLAQAHVVELLRVAQVTVLVDAIHVLLVAHLVRDTVSLHVLVDAPMDAEMHVMVHVKQTLVHLDHAMHAHHIALMHVVRAVVVPIYPHHHLPKFQDCHVLHVVVHVGQTVIQYAQVALVDALEHVINLVRTHVQAAVVVAKITLLHQDVLLVHVHQVVLENVLDVPEHVRMVITQHHQVHLAQRQEVD